MFFYISKTSSNMATSQKSTMMKIHSILWWLIFPWFYVWTNELWFRQRDLKGKKIAESEIAHFLLLLLSSDVTNLNGLCVFFGELSQWNWKMCNQMPKWFRRRSQCISSLHKTYYLYTNKWKPLGVHIKDHYHGFKLKNSCILFIYPYSIGSLPANKCCFIRTDTMI